MANRALVIVHLSSIESYRSACGRDAANNLADALEHAAKDVVSKHGIVYVVDQFWSGSLRDRVARNLERVGAKFLRFDEAKTTWEWFLPRLYGRLRRDKVDQVTVAGIWFDPKLETGCATTVYLYLKGKFPTMVDEDLVAWECDEDDEDVQRNPSRALSAEETADEYDRGRANEFLTGGCLDWAQAYIDHVGGTLVGVFVNGSMEHVMVKDGKFVVDAVGVHRPSAVVSWFKKAWKTKDVKFLKPREKDLRLLEADDDRYDEARAHVYNQYRR
jgi:hypothetical protein